MTLPIVPDTPEPAGFGNCQKCAYSLTGPIARCYTCARATLSPPAEFRCEICDQKLRSPDAECSNGLCTSPARQFEWTAAIAVKTGALERAILRVKEGNWAWGYIFSRVVLGYLYDNPNLTSGLAAIIPTPAFVEPGEDRRVTDHAYWVIKQAHEQDDTGLPFVYDPPLIRKAHPTPKMRQQASANERRTAAQQLYEALVVPDSGRVKDKEIMVYDDVFTGGNTLNAVARRLKEAGAAHVYGLTLARQQWRS